MADNLTPTGRVSKAQTRSELLFGKGRSTLPPAFRGRKINLTMEEFVNMIRLLPSVADKAFLQYTVALSQRALVIFSHSFESRRFYSSNGKPWKPITDTTWKMRQYHSKKFVRKCASRDQILRDFGVLTNSLEIKGTPMGGVGIYRRTVWTNPEKFNSPIHHGFVYAGVHNNPGRGDTYGTKFGRKRAVRRQFMGHSTYMDSFITRYSDRYLFSEIFNKPSK